MRKDSTKCDGRPSTARRFDRTPGAWLQYPAVGGIAFVRRVVTASLRSVTAAAEAQTMAASIQDEGEYRGRRVDLPVVRRARELLARAQ